MKYYAYGSNMSLKRLQQRVPSAVPLGTFSLPEYKLIFHKHGMDDSAKCDAFYTGDGTDIVIGRLYEIDEDHKPSLDRAEGLGRGYEIKNVNISGGNGGSFTAFLYYATNINASLLPYTWYIEHMLTGALEAGLPEEYISAVASTPAVEDCDQLRQQSQLAVYK